MNVSESNKSTWKTKPTIVDRVHEDLNFGSVKIQLAGRITVDSVYNVVDERLLYGRQARLVFAILVLERHRPVHRHELAEALWPHGLPRTWDTALRGVLSKVRTFLTTAGLSESAARYRGSGGYQLVLPSDVLVDIEWACAAVETAERILCEGDIERAIELAECAKMVARCPFLSAETGQWVDGVRDCLGQVLRWALCVLSEAYAQRGRYRLAARTAENAIALEPFRERTYQLLMRVHAAAGNPAEALRTFDRCRRLLADELGVDPAAETTALHLALLKNEGLTTAPQPTILTQDCPGNVDHQTT